MGVEGSGFRASGRSEAMGLEISSFVCFFCAGRGLDSVVFVGAPIGP